MFPKYNIVPVLNALTPTLSHLKTSILSLCQFIECIFWPRDGAESVILKDDVIDSCVVVFQITLFFKVTLKG